jgi:hypothetical protein
MEAGMLNPIGRLIRRAWWGMAMLAIIAMAMSPARAKDLVFLGLQFPPAVAGAQAGDTVDYESTQPGLGYSVQYLRSGWKIDVYVYDLQQRAVPEDPQSDIIRSQLKAARDEIFLLQRMGAYRKVAHRGDFVIRDVDRRPRFACATFSLVRQGFGTADSFLCLAGWRNRFVKFRLTTARHTGSAAEARGFVAAWSDILWPSI